MSFGRCECGEEVILAGMQLHQKLGPTAVLVCKKSLKIPSECDAPTLAKVRRDKDRTHETYTVYVREEMIGAVGKLQIGGWLWATNGGTGIEGTFREAVRKTLEKTLR